MIKKIVIALIIFNSVFAEINFTIDSSPRCVLGDLDLISMDFSQSKENKLLLSLLDSNKKEHVINMNEPHYKFDESKFSDGVIIVSICKDSNNSNSCLNKKVISFKDLMQKHSYSWDAKSKRMKQETNNDKNNQDSIYYRYVIVKKGDKISILSDKVKDLTKNLIKITNNKTESENIKQELLLLQSLAPQEIDEKNLKIDLPHFSDKKCNKK